MNVKLQQFVRTMPRNARLRRLARRKLRAVRPSRANELWYKAELLALVRRARAAVRSHVTKPSGYTGKDSAKMEFESALNNAARSLGNINEQAQRLAYAAVLRSRKTVDERLIAAVKSSVNVDLTGMLSGSDRLSSAVRLKMQENVDLITSLPMEYLDEVRTMVAENLAEGLRWEAIADNIEQRGDVSESRAKLIARDQTSKMNAAFNEVRQTELGIEEYEWQTSDDERVRDSHREKEGQTFRWDDPPDDTGHPGEDIQCRCTAIPIINLDAIEEDALS